MVWGGGGAALARSSFACRVGAAVGKGKLDAKKAYSRESAFRLNNDQAMGGSMRNFSLETSRGKRVKHGYIIHYPQRAKRKSSAVGGLGVYCAR